MQNHVTTLTNTTTKNKLETSPAKQDRKKLKVVICREQEIKIRIHATMQNHVTALTNTKNIASQAGQTKVEGCRRRRRGNVHKKEEKGLHRAFVFCPETECKYKYNHKNENTKEKYTNIMTNNIEIWSQKI